MSWQKPWSMYRTVQEIGEALQKGIAEKLQLPTRWKMEGEQFLIILSLPGNAAHIRFSLDDLKSLYGNVEEFVNFIDQTWRESMEAVQKEK